MTMKVKKKNGEEGCEKIIVLLHNWGWIKINKNDPTKIIIIKIKSKDLYKTKHNNMFIDR